MSGENNKQQFSGTLEIMLTKVTRDKDVIDTALTSGVIMGVVWGQHSSLRTCEVTSTGSCWKEKGRN